MTREMFALWAVIVWVLVAHWQLMRRFVRQTVPLLHQQGWRGGGGGERGDNTLLRAVVMLIPSPGVYYVPINYDKSERFWIIQLNYRGQGGQTGVNTLSPHSAVSRWCQGGSVRIIGVKHSLPAPPGPTLPPTNVKPIYWIVSTF